MRNNKGGKNLKKEGQRKDKVKKAGGAKWRKSRSLGLKEDKKVLTGLEKAS